MTFFRPVWPTLLPSQETASGAKPVIASAQVLTAKISVGNGREIEIAGKIIYAITKIDHDDSLQGELTYILSEKSFTDVATSLGKNTRGGEMKLSFDCVSALPQKLTGCPDIGLEFKPQLLSARVNGDTVTVRFDSFLLKIKTDEQ
ncbi:MAG: hypothetical protein JNJ50_00320 [Acidobacteria bacterium]|nr:hypothetical protein [Acidobacteriota bacterium]